LKKHNIPPRRVTSHGWHRFCCPSSFLFFPMLLVLPEAQLPLLQHFQQIWKAAKSDNTWCLWFIGASKALLWSCGFKRHRNSTVRL
jgi:ABC-type uncharacterized transport system permease subunit